MDALYYFLTRYLHHPMAYAIIFFILLFIFARRVSKYERLMHYHQTFLDYHTSTREFYKKIQERMQGCEIKKLGTPLSIKHREGGLFSKRRLYLRFSKGKYVIDACAAPYGTGYFFSYVVLPQISLIRALLHRAPVIGPILFTRYHRQTAYQLDAAKAFGNTFHTHFIEAIDEVSKARGSRLLQEDEKKPVMGELFVR